MSKQNDLSVQEQIDKLNTLMEWFERDDVDIEEALAKFEEADVLARDIEHRLSSLKNEITVLKERFDKE